MNAKTFIATLIAGLMIAPSALAHANTHVVNFAHPAYTPWNWTGPSGAPCEQGKARGASLAAPWTGPVYTLNGHAAWALDGDIEQLHYAVLEYERDDAFGLGICGTTLPWASGQIARAALHGGIVSVTGADVLIEWDADTVHTWATTTQANFYGNCFLYVNSAYHGMDPVDPATGKCDFLLPSLNPGVKFELHAYAIADNPNVAIASLIPAGQPLQTKLIISTATGPAHGDEILAGMTP